MANLPLPAGLVNDYRACKMCQKNKDIPWPVLALIRIIEPKNIIFHPDDLNNFQGVGNYFQAKGKITIGHVTYIVPNVGIITSNHSIEDLDAHESARAVTLSAQCWIGINSVILPGVILGKHTIVGAGSVVTKSFPQGNCVIAGKQQDRLSLQEAMKDENTDCCRRSASIH